MADPVHEEGKPFLPGTVIADRLKAIDVLVPVLLEEERRVQDRSLQDLLFDQPEGDEEPADPSISIEERMDRLELRVRQTCLDEGRYRSRIVQESL